MRCLRRAQAALELALVLPLVLMAFLGFVAVGQIYVRQEALSSTAAYVARRAATLPDGTMSKWPASLTGDAREVLGGLFDPAEVKVEIAPDTVPYPCYPNQIAVRVSAPLSVDVPFYGKLSATMAGSARSLCERD